MRKQSPAKEYLRKIRTEQIELRVLLNKREELRLSLYPPAIRYDKPRVQVSPFDAMPAATDEMREVDNEITDHISRLEKRRLHAMKIIRQIDDPLCRMVLELYYLTAPRRRDGKILMTWAEVAGIMGYDEKHVVRELHPRALEKFANLMEMIA